MSKLSKAPAFLLFCTHNSNLLYPEANVLIDIFSYFLFLRKLLIWWYYFDLPCILFITTVHVLISNQALNMVMMSLLLYGTIFTLLYSSFLGDRPSILTNFITSRVRQCLYWGCPSTVQKSSYSFWSNENSRWLEKWKQLGPAISTSKMNPNIAV